MFYNFSVLLLFEYPKLFVQKIKFNRIGLILIFTEYLTVSDHYLIHTIDYNLL